MRRESFVTRPVCKVGAARTALPKVDGDLLADWTVDGLVDGEPVPASVMAAALAENGHRMAESTVKAHRRQRCVCFRSSREQP